MDTFTGSLEFDTGVLPQPDRSTATANAAAAVLYILCFIDTFLLFLPHIVIIPYLHHYAMLWSNPVYCNIFLIYLKGRRSGSYFFHKIVKIDFSIMGVYNDHNRLLSDFEGKN